MGETQRWIVVQQPGYAPVTKRPPQSVAGVSGMLREIMRLYPDASTLVIELFHGPDLWPTSGPEWLAMFDADTEAP